MASRAGATMSRRKTLSAAHEAKSAALMLGQLPVSASLLEALSSETEAERAARFKREFAVWGAAHEIVGGDLYFCYFRRDGGVRNQTDGAVRFQSYAPVTARHWFFALLRYCQQRTDLVPARYAALGYGFNSGLLRRGNVHEWPESPVVAPLLMDFLSEHSARSKRWAWFLAHVDKASCLSHVDPAPGIWVTGQ